MRTEILKGLREFELKENVQILLASEVGSHAWGYASSSSDYDIRFIFVYPPERYLTIDNPKEGIDLVINDQLDFRGWELRKTLRLFRKSNPSLFEALHSPVIYKKDEAFFSRMIELESGIFSKSTCYSHYFHMARQNLKAWESAVDPPIKLLFHCLRPVLMCKWLEEQPSLPPLSLPKLLADYEPSLNVLFEALHRKRHKYGNLIKKNTLEAEALHAFIADTYKEIEQKRLNENEDGRAKGTGSRNEFIDERLNDLFRHMLKVTFPGSF